MFEVWHYYVSETPADEKERIQGHMKKRETGNLAGILAGTGIMIILAGGLIAFSGPSINP